MPVSVVRRPRRGGGSGTSIANRGTQTVLGELALTNPTVVELRPTTFNAPGTYTLFTYTTFPLNYLDKQTQLNQRLTIDGSKLVGLRVLDIHGTAVSTENKVTVTLVTI